MRVIPWSIHARNADRPWDRSFYQTDAYKVTMKQGDILLRDVRVAHSGTPNVGVGLRPLPGVQILSPMWQDHLDAKRERPKRERPEQPAGDATLSSSLSSCFESSACIKSLKCVLL